MRPAQHGSLGASPSRAEQHARSHQPSRAPGRGAKRGRHEIAGDMKMARKPASSSNRSTSTCRRSARPRRARDRAPRARRSRACSRSPRRPPGRRTARLSGPWQPRDRQRRARTATEPERTPTRERLALPARNAAAGSSPRSPTSPVIWRAIDRKAAAWACGARKKTARDGQSRVLTTCLPRDCAGSGSRPRAEVSVATRDDTPLHRDVRGPLADTGAVVAAAEHRLPVGPADALEHAGAHEPDDGVRNPVSRRRDCARQGSPQLVAPFDLWLRRRTRRGAPT